MKIKITELARVLYGKMCPVSTGKCDSIEELDYKIQRCISLGKHVKSYKEKRSGKKLIQYIYYNNVFTIHNNMIIDIWKSKECYSVSEDQKTKHYNKTFKVVV